MSIPTGAGATPSHTIPTTRCSVPAAFPSAARTRFRAWRRRAAASASQRPGRPRAADPRRAPARPALSPRRSGRRNGALPPTASVTAYHDGDLHAPADVAVRYATGPFRTAAWDVLRTVPAGQVISYAQMEERIGRLADVVGVRAGRIDLHDLLQTRFAHRALKQPLCQRRAADIAHADE